MTSLSTAGLVNNVALLLAMILIYDIVFLRHIQSESFPKQVFLGAILGVIGVGIMMNPVEFLPGIIFDTRSVLLCITGFFFGTVPTVIAVSITGGYRVVLGGTGTWTGIAVIITSGAVGLTWRQCRKGNLKNASVRELYLLGIVTHILMLVCMLTLPQAVAFDVISRISLPVMLVLPLGAVLMGRLLINRLDRIQAASALELSEAKYRDILENAVEGFFQSTPEGRFLAVNPSFSRMFGYESPEAMIADISDISRQCYIDPEERRRWQREMTKNGKIENFEFRAKRKDGSEIWLSDSSRAIYGPDGHILLYEGNVSDISDRKKNEEYYRQIIESSIDGFMIVDQDGYILDVNDAYCKLVGYDRNAMLKMSVDRIEAMESASDVERRIKEITALGRGRFETRHRCKSGRILDVETSTTFSEKNGGIFFSFIRDITHQKQHESEQEITLHLLQALHQDNSLETLIRNVITLMADGSGCDAVGIRIRKGDDYPYFETRGFLPDFVEAESRLCRLDANGKPILDGSGNPLLECMCGNVIHGRFDPALPFFTPNGSFWTNSTTALLASSTEAERQSRTRNRCNGEGYESVALIPLRAGNQSLGLLQFNDRHPNKFNEKQIRLFERLASSLAIGISHRITASKLRERNQILSAVLDHTHIMAAMLDTRFNFIWVNSAYAEKDRRDAAFYPGRNHFDLYPHEENQRIFQSVVDTGTAFFTTARPFEYPGQPDRGVTYWDWSLIPVKDDNENTTGLVFTLVDVTEQVRAGEALRESEERYRAFFEKGPDGVVIIDPDVAGPIDFNDQVCRQLGYSRKEFAMLTLHDIDGIETRDDTRKRIRNVMDKGHDDFDTLQRTKQGELRNVHVTAQVIEVGGRPVYHCIWRDITERKRMEEELLKTQKLESVGMLAGGIAHDFNNILTTIIGNTALAKDHAAPESELFDLLNEIETTSTRARTLTRQLLTFAKGGAPVKDTVSIKELIRESAAFVLRGSKTLCEYFIAKDLWPVEIDVGQMNQVIHNIVINANQAMPDGGILHVRAENLMIGEKDGLPVLPGRYIRISISDQGVGIAEKHLFKIFDPYFTTKHEGSGLGLATSYAVVKKHGGYITAESELGKGSTFHIYLPASDKSIPSKTPFALLRNQGKILIMDDEAALRKIIGRMLQRLGYEPDFATDGAEVIGKYQTAMASESPYDAVILDMTIPGGMGGKEAVRRLLEMDPGVKAIVFSGYSDDPVLSNFRDYGFVGMMPKPFEFQTLSHVLDNVLNNPASKRP
ncbi:PAS domain S-box protein [Desulfococcus multivorans]|uniref:histidine kinase n=1 Tax=Desulfococcus multivorans DSM 2059 TaxID=1121405 RepID=S7VAK6_DESML|nr:PAS domain S-box protein [Desulfococcus multivorans]AOY58602.1 putative two component system sensor histidine kinase, hybrid [Desulfococcus multivorans]AQX36461.1 hypothetical protein B2D07_19890 [Desulfococcus multivorans]EPR41548.1 multi-sensor hybrid histidine kinase [Desulfococcus multivorans DSM 2059]SJZ44457.1 PAS domain S-box-containing protein [Desulfococcus multivorans DSM 2059]